MVTTTSLDLKYGEKENKDGITPKNIVDQENDKENETINNKIVSALRERDDILGEKCVAGLESNPNHSYTRNEHCSLSDDQEVRLKSIDKEGCHHINLFELVGQIQADSYNGESTNELLK